MDQELTIDNPTNLPTPPEIDYMEEPMVEAEHDDAIR